MLGIRLELDTVLEEDPNRYSSSELILPSVDASSKPHLITIQHTLPPHLSLQRIVVEEEKGDEGELAEVVEEQEQREPEEAAPQSPPETPEILSEQLDKGPICYSNESVEAANYGYCPYSIGVY
ncbi:hypothetical protein ACA910_004432 [Epithemia clementina (nom. ined.)]